jgi:hypothetical protein
VTTCCLPAGRAPLCPIISAPTTLVSLDTVTQHVLLPYLPDTTFGFCDAPGCDVVYVGADGTLIRKEQLRTRVGVKETEDPIPVCYCFELTARQIAEDVRQHGRSTIREYIQEQVRAGQCHCEMTNPAGRCCLGNVGRVIGEARAVQE